MLTEYFSELCSRDAKGEKLTLDIVIAGVGDLDQDLTLIADWVVLKGLCTLPVWKKAVATAKRNHKVKAALGRVPTSASDYLDAFAERTSAIIGVDGRVKMVDPENSPAIMTTTESHFARLARIQSDGLGLGYTHATLTDAADEFMLRARRRRRARLMATLDHDPAATCDWAALAKATCQEDPEYVAANFKHFMWQVKRKQKNLPLVHHLMLIFGGAQNVGKSTFAKALFSPITELSRNSSFSMLTDERVIEMWSAAVIFMDEMAFATRADSDEVKNVITADTLDRRPMRSNGTDKIAQMATLIGTTNQVLGQIIRDTTGVRRFSYLTFLANPDYDVINSIDWAQAWRAVDENGPAPIIPHREALQAIQEDARHRSTVEQWIDSFEARDTRALLQAQEAAKGNINRNVLFDSYRLWLADAGIHERDRLDLAAFGRELKRLETSTGTPVFRFKRTASYNGWVFNAKTVPHPEIAA